MAFKIEERFEVQAPVERVWEYLIDPKRVVECLPGAELLEQQDEHTFTGAIKVKVGPLSMSYKGSAKFTEVNEQMHQVRMVGDAREVGGSGSTKVSMLSTVAPLPSGERVRQHRPSPPLLVWVARILSAIRENIRPRASSRA